MRFDAGKALPEAEKLRDELYKKNIDLQIINADAGDDITETVFNAIENAHAFLVFGTDNYGENTGNPASTFYEAKFAQSRRGLRIILIRMIPFDQKFEHLQARQMFGLNKLELSWMRGKPIPKGLVDEIAAALENNSQESTANKKPVSRRRVPIALANESHRAKSLKKRKAKGKRIPRKKRTFKKKNRKKTKRKRISRK